MMKASADRLIEVFHEAKARSAGVERERFLAEACGDDVELRAQVLSLLQAHEGAGDFLKAGPAYPGLAAISEKPGDKIGRYKLLQQIGEGGCGVVYMAEQEEPVRRRVALKIIKLGMDTKGVVARFEAERQALALMDHPNIAKVFDGGATETGRPFFVMELVRGTRFTEYCDQHNLSTQQRLELFIQVCQAIQHAHQKGIIHRDIKPSNILITVNDGLPVPKVIDFGIAKATEQRLTDKTVFTAFEQFIGTPAYMSPEQAEMTSLDIDTRADVYSLGVLLYELLTGATPFDQKQLLAAGLDEMRRTIREVEPVKPSTRLTQELERIGMGSTRVPGVASGVAPDARSPEETPPMKVLDATPRTARETRALPEQLKDLISALRGDLDWIAMKCLEKDRARRYETANALAADIRRYLDCAPVIARPPSRWYEFQKMVRRHKFGFAATAAVIVALALGIVMSTMQAVRARRAEREQEGLRRLAEQTRQEADARAYASDMALASLSVDSGGSLGNAAKALSYWRAHAPRLRGWEWYFLYGLVHRDRLTIRSDNGGFYAVAWSPDGERLASAGQDHTVRLWNAVTGNEIMQLMGHTATVAAVAWSPGGKQLASASNDGTVIIWDAEGAGTIATLRAHTNELRCVAWSRDGKKLASGGLNQPIQLFDVATGKLIRALPVGALSHNIRAVSWNRDGTRLASADSIAGVSSAVTVWDTVHGEELFTVGREAMTSVAWSPDDKWLALAGYSSCGLILDVASRSNRLVMCHAASVEAVAWSSDGARVATGSRGDGTVKIWDFSTGQELQCFRGHLGSARSVSWHPDGTQVASASPDGTIRVWDVNHRDESRTTRRLAAQVISVAWHPDATQLATGCGDGSIHIWDARRAVESVVFPGHTSGVWKVVWNPKGTLLASCSHDGAVRLWNPKTSAEVWSVQAHPKEVRALAWSPDGKRLASVSGSDGDLKFWDADSGRLMATFAKDIGAMALDWSPDGTQLATSSKTGILVLDAVSGRERWTLRGHTEPLRSVAWSPDGKRLASASDDTTIRVWDLEAGRELHTLQAHVGQVYSAAWSPDGTRLVSASWDGTIKIWNPDNGTLVCSLAGHHAPGQSAQWSPDGTRIASSDTSGVFLIHDATPGMAVEGLARSEALPEKPQGRQEPSR
jgi:WD40 repeat protein/serine/threonine protein kinase